MASISERPAEILLVEDNLGDIRLTTEALKEGRIVNHLHVATDGEEAIAFLRKEGSHADKPRPDLILLDLNLPKKDGREVLAEIKADENLRRIPVIVLTTSKAQEDVLKMYNLHVNCYINKPVDFNEFLDVIRGIQDFWLSIVALPNGTKN